MPERLRSEGVVLVPGLAAVALFVYWGAHEGGYLPTTWLPSALLVLGLLAATALGLGGARMRLPRPAAIAAGALAAYVALSYLSIAWARSPGDAFEGSNRTLLFLLLFLLFALLPWRAWTSTVALSAFALGIGVLAVVTLARLGSAGDVRELFIDGRLSEPTGYVNSTPALFTTAALVAIALAARRELPAPLRAVLLALATAGLQASVLSESRGWLFALPIVAIGMVAVVPDRVRLCLWALPPLAGTALASPALLDVFERVDAAETPAGADRALVDAAASAGEIALPLCAAVLAVGLALALLDRRVSVSSATAAAANRAAAGLAIVAAIAAVAVGFALTDGRPDRAIGDYWDRSSGYQDTDPGASRFVSLGSNRPDYWRVALDAFGEKPLVGLGQDNWSDYYLRHRDSSEQPRWVHSVELRVLVHTGVVGFLLLAAFLAAALAAALTGRRRGRRASAEHAVAAIALLPLLVWFVHGSIDWFWEMPALSGPAFAFLGLATAVASTRERAAEDAADGAPGRARRAGGVRTAGAVAAGAAVVVAAIAFTLPWLSARDTAEATSSWRSDPTRALARLDRAADLDPLSARPDLVAGVIALELDAPRVARARFDRALERDPDDWFAHFGRGLAETATGDRAAARADYTTAHALSPDEPLIDEALRRIDRRRPMTAAEAFARLRADVRRLTGGR